MTAVAGTVTLARLLWSDTERPPVGARPVIDTVPVELEPPVTEAGLTETEASELLANA